MINSSNLQNEHAAALARIQSKVKCFYDHKKHFRVYHGSTSSTRPMSFARDAIVDTSDMHRLFPVKAVSETAATVQAEPNVPMDALAAHCIAAGWVPKIVMEFKGITCGGGYSGMSGESAMYKYGLFQNTVCEVEIVLADGEVVIANQSQNTELLHEAGGSLGTFGVVTLLTIELIPATTHVQVQIRPISDPLTVPEIFESACHNPDIDYIDGIYFNKASAVIMYGKMLNDDSPLRNSQAPLLTTKQVHWFAETIRQHLASHNHILDTNTNKEMNQTSVSSKVQDPGQITPVLMTLTDYLFRYDHGAFWGGTLAFRHYHVPQNRITRRLADPFLDSRTCYHALHKTGLADEYVVQDFGLPASSVVQFMSYVAATMPECMIFLCPMRAARDVHIDKRFNSKVAMVDDQRIFGVGVYGRGPRDSVAFHDLNRKLELKASELLGAKLLYARTYYTEDEFWQIYDKQYYDEVRARWKATSLPSVYDKLRADMKVIRKRRSVRGALETVWDKARGNKDYLLAKA